MEIERKFLIPNLPPNYTEYPHKSFEQGYICQEPVVRIRREENEYFLTCKGKGLLSREEFTLDLTEESFEKLLSKVEGHTIKKTRYFIPYNDNLTIELDIFHNEMESLIMAEVEFQTEAIANSFQPPSWFGEEVTYNKDYHNVNMIFR